MLQDAPRRPSRARGLLPELLPLWVHPTTHHTPHHTTHRTAPHRTAPSPCRTAPHAPTPAPPTPRHSALRFTSMRHMPTFIAKIGECLWRAAYHKLPELCRERAPNVCVMQTYRRGRGDFMDYHTDSRQTYVGQPIAQARTPTHAFPHAPPHPTQPAHPSPCRARRVVGPRHRRHHLHDRFFRHALLLPRHAGWNTLARTPAFSSSDSVQISASRRTPSAPWTERFVPTGRLQGGWRHRSCLDFTAALPSSSLCARPVWGCIHYLCTRLQISACAPRSPCLMDVVSLLHSNNTTRTASYHETSSGIGSIGHASKRSIESST